ncbi:hypothetical protein EUGRSUZ_B03579 [Eucalyptus grandis]|uniref:Uncharacterized protein n=2 Tax=Eucalyptus grandis TaxID=71139 RepID=A0ACC3LY78_EUCGR|nr:hypothetical protein EUGRSUZ_B03579 [Eucalyptus grandis]
MNGGSIRKLKPKSQYTDGMCKSCGTMTIGDDGLVENDVHLEAFLFGSYFLWCRRFNRSKYIHVTDCKVKSRVDEERLS